MDAVATLFHIATSATSTTIFDSQVVREVRKSRKIIFLTTSAKLIVVGRHENWNCLLSVASSAGKGGGFCVF
jgi:hypothetical protein